MNLSPEDIALIEKHLDGVLTAEEERLFLEQQDNSPEFREAVNFQRQLLVHLEAQQKAAIKSELKGMLQDLKQARGFQRRVLWVAASVILLAGVFGVMQLLGPSPSQQLFDQYFDPYPILSVVRGDTPNGLDPLRLYAQGQYEVFVETVASSRDSTVNNFKSTKLQLAYGNALLAIGEPERAIHELSKIVEGQKHYPDAQWYLALAFLKLEDYVQTEQILRNLIRQDSFYQSSATRLLSSIEKTANNG